MDWTIQEYLEYIQHLIEQVKQDEVDKHQRWCYNTRVDNNTQKGKPWHRNCKKQSTTFLAWTTTTWIKWSWPLNNEELGCENFSSGRHCELQQSRNDSDWNCAKGEHQKYTCETIKLRNCVASARKHAHSHKTNYQLRKEIHKWLFALGVTHKNHCSLRGVMLATNMWALLNNCWGIYSMQCLLWDCGCWWCGDSLNCWACD